MAIDNFPDSQVLASFCSAAPGQPYWLFQVLGGDDIRPRVYRLPEYPSDWPAKARWTHVEDREPLLSIALKRTIVL
jgi:hypothetical protein